MPELNLSHIPVEKLDDSDEFTSNKINPRYDNSKSSVDSSSQIKPKRNNKKISNSSLTKQSASKPTKVDKNLDIQSPTVNKDQIKVRDRKRVTKVIQLK